MKYNTTRMIIVILAVLTIFACNKKPEIEHQDIIITKKQFNNDEQYDYLTQKFGVITVGFFYDKTGKYEKNKIISNVVYCFIRKIDNRSLITVAGQLYKDNIYDSNLKSLIRSKSSSVNILQKEKIIGFPEKIMRNPFEIKGLRETDKLNHFEETSVLLKLSIDKEGNLVILN